MSEDRKYKQRGYQDDGREGRGGSSLHQGELPRSRVITNYKETVRCDQCGVDLSTLFDVQEGTLCPKCSAPMHSCRNCYNFDTSARFQCTEPVKERVSKKDAGNGCGYFRVRTIRVKDIGGTTAPVRSEDAKKALEDLFKK